MKRPLSLPAALPRRLPVVFIILSMNAIVAAADNPPPTRAAVIDLQPAASSREGSAQVETLDHVQVITGLHTPDDTAAWTAAVKAPGLYEILMTYACPKENAGGQYEVQTDGRTIRAVTTCTGGRQDCNSEAIGSIRLDHAGEVTVKLRPTRAVGDELMILRSVVLNPATAEQIRRRQSSATQPAKAGDEPLIANIDVSEVPQLEDWALHARRQAIEWYPVVAGALKTDGFDPPRQFSLVFRAHMHGVAGTSGTRIAIAASWVEAHPEDIGMVGHELTHVIQHYPQSDAGWLVEGIADYIRYDVLEPGSLQGRFDPAQSSYKQGYQPAAGLLAFTEKNYGPGIVNKLNTALRAGKYDPEMFQQLTGKTIDELWEACKAAHVKK